MYAAADSELFPKIFKGLNVVILRPKTTKEPHEPHKSIFFY